MTEGEREPMTVGKLAARTGVSPKTIRDLEGRGLIYSASRSESNYRLFGEEALWCIETITGLRSLGLTLGEVEQLGRAYLERPQEPFGPRLDEALERVERRARARLAELEQILARIGRFGPRTLPRWPASRALSSVRRIRAGRAAAPPDLPDSRLTLPQGQALAWGGR